MSIVRYNNPFTEMRKMNKLVDDIFGETSTIRTPAVDIAENEDAYLFEMDLPGFSEEEITVEVAADQLRISAEKITEEKEEAEKEEEQEENAMSYIRKERRQTTYRRSFSFKKPVDPNEASVELKNGVLTISLAKAEESKPRRLEIKATN